MSLLQDPTRLDPCGNLVCDADETPATCPSDCLVKSLKTVSVVDASSKGQIFTIEATKDLTIFSLDILSRRAGDSDIVVYTRPHSYQGYEETNSGWELIFDKTISVSRGARSNLGALDREVNIPAGSLQSFYVWSGQGQLYSKGNYEGSQFASDDTLVITEGAATRNLFQQVTGNAKYSGWIRYVFSKDCEFHHDIKT